MTSKRILTSALLIGLTAWALFFAGAAVFCAMSLVFEFHDQNAFFGTWRVLGGVPSLRDKIRGYRRVRVWLAFWAAQPDPAYFPEEVYRRHVGWSHDQFCRIPFF